MGRRQPQACFFCHLHDKTVFNRVEYYTQDIAALEALGYEVHLTTTTQELRWADLYFGWWWTWAFIPVTWAQLLRKPVILTGVFNLWKFNERPWYERQLHEWSLKRADANLFLSQLEFTGVTSRLTVNHPYYCPLGVDSNHYLPGNHPREPFLLCIAGAGISPGNVRRKCLEELIRSLPLFLDRWPELRLVMVGEQLGGYPTLLRLVEKLDLQAAVEFKGVVSRAEKIDLLQRCSLYVQPSRFEGFGLGILEAMSCGAPVLTSPVGAVSEVVGDTAAFVDGTSPEAIATGILELLNDTRRRHQLGESARERALQHFSSDNRRQAIAAIIEGLDPGTKLHRGTERKGGSFSTSQ